MSADIKVLVVEDGDEYLTNLSTFVARGIRYTQAKSGTVACGLLPSLRPDLVYLDMRFDRTPNEALLARSSRTTRGCSCSGRCATPASTAR